MKTFNFSDRRLNKEQQEAFINGYELMVESIESIGWQEAKDLFNWANENIKIYSTLGHAFASGEMEALIDYKQKA